MLLDDAIADDDNLAMLDAFLADRVNDDGLMLCELDGFLTAIAIGPELVLPSEWVPLIWGANSPNCRRHRSVLEKQAAPRR